MGKRLIVFLIFFNISYGGSLVDADATDGQIKTGTELLLKQYNWNVFWKEFSISASDWVMCKTKDPKKGMFGMAATMIEPLYLIDVTQKNNKIASLGLTIGKARPDKNGDMIGNGGVYVNVFKFPLMHMILKKTTKGLFAFENDYPKLVYLGILDPKKWNDILAFSLIPERGLFETVFGALAGAASCVANSTFALLPASYKRDSDVGKQLRTIMDSAYYSMGCVGNIPTGTISTHENPIITAKLVAGSVLSDMHSNKGVVATLNTKHRIRSVLNGYTKDILCRGVKNPLMPVSQYTMQLLYPTVGKTNELGISPMNYAFKGKGKADKTVIMVVNQRKDYAAFAYQD